ncbi:MAG TPA: thymidylate kinase [Planctomycetaceae bacterium]
MPGKLIAIEGIDGSGKGTQAKLLRDRFLAAGATAALLSFPRYAETRFGGYVGEYLNGRFGSLDEVHPFLASLLFAGDRFESREVIRDALERHDVVVCDRYVASNVAHQAAKCDGAARQELIRRIEEVEFEVYRLPRPDRTVLLDLSVENARRLIALKAKRSYTDRTEDLHESDGIYLGAVGDVYRARQASDPTWVRIACERDGVVRPIEAIHADVWDAVRA